LSLWVLGDGKVDKYSNAVSSLAVETVFWGGQADTVKFYLAADYLVHPARKEAAGMVIAESLAARLPILVTSLCGYAFLAADDTNSVILKSENVVDELASHLRTILKQDTLVRGEGSPQIAFKSRAIFCADQIEGWYSDEK
jgi:UDP-glucose:(heptosyl)LPS alpha-1,3-glucosyltransferase